MKPILIQGAENSEINYLLEILQNKKETEIGSFKFWTGEIENYPIVVSRTKVGEINSAIATTIGIMNFEPKYIINQGTAGSHSKDIHRGDVVVGKEYFGLTNIRTELREEGEGVDVKSWLLKPFQSDDDEVVSRKANSELLEFVKTIKNEYATGKVHFGVFGSGDIWNREIDRINFLNKEHGTLCEEMETAGVYNTANSFGVPAIGIRIISNNEILKEEYKPEMATECQVFVEKVIKRLIKNILFEK